MSPNVATFLFEAANFLSLAAVLGWVFFRPVRDALERRRAALAAEERRGVEQRTEAERQLAALRQQRHDFEASLDAQRDEVRRRAETDAARVIDDAKAEAQRERERVRDQLAAERRVLAQSASRDAASAAAVIVGDLLTRIDGPDLGAALLRAACRELAALGAHATLQPAMIETTGPLDESSRAQLAQALRCAPTELSVRVVPELVAGVRILTTAGLVDASAAGLAAAAERALLARLSADESGHA